MDLEGKFSTGAWIRFFDQDKEAQRLKARSGERYGGAPEGAPDYEPLVDQHLNSSVWQFLVGYKNRRVVV